MRRILFTVVILTLFLPLTSCTRYRSQEVSFKHPSAYAGMQMVSGAQVAAEGYADKTAARESFGFDIREVGILPVQVIIDNNGTHPLTIVPEQTFLIDEKGNLWNLLDRRTAYQRVESSTEFSRIAGGAGRRSVLGAAGGALVGAALGVLTGENVGTAATKGAAVGAAGGAVIGGVEAGTSPDAGSRQISRDLATKELENRAIAPGSLARGFLFFPGEAPSAGQLRLQLKEVDSAAVHTVLLPL
jgi:hypothetical protein